MSAPEGEKRIAVGATFAEAKRRMKPTEVKAKCLVLDRGRRICFWDVEPLAEQPIGDQQKTGWH